MKTHLLMTLGTSPLISSQSPFSHIHNLDRQPITFRCSQIAVMQTGFEEIAYAIGQPPLSTDTGSDFL